MFLSKDWSKVVRVDYGIASTLPFRINIPLSSESVQFSAKMTRMEPDNKIELRKILRPPHLPSDQHLSSRKILNVFMICNNIDGIGQILQVMLPNFESFKDGK